MKRWIVPTSMLMVGLTVGAYFMQARSHGQAVNENVPAISGDLVTFRHIVKKVLPAVVSIESKSKLITRTKTQTPRLPEGVPDEFRRFFEDLPQTPNVPRQQTGFGSGFFIDANGTVLTNYHVVEGAEKVTVEMQDGRRFVSSDIHGDRRSDLAVIKLDLKGSTVKFLEFGDSNDIEIGDRVLAVGAPFGLTGSVTQGIISGKGRAGLNMNMYEDFLQTDAAINPGNSGGPLVNLNGQVVGINAAIKSRSGGFQGVGLAIASNLAKNVSTALRRDGVVHRGYLGVQIRDLDADVAQRLGLPKNSGTLVSEVYDNTPASQGGMRAGDVIVSIAGNKVSDGRSLQNIVAGLPINKAVDIVVMRDGKNVNLSITIREQPNEFGTASLNEAVPDRAEPSVTSVDKVGVHMSDISAEKARVLGFRSGSQGALISKVDDGSLAANVGLRPGMLITKVDNVAVTSAEAARQAMEKASISRGILLQVQSARGGTNLVLIQSATNS